jgi:hypothetical protein
VPEINERWLDASTLVGLEVMGDDGELIGHLVDISFDQDSLEVENYLLRAGFFERLIGRRGRIQPQTLHACSRELMLVTTGRVTERVTEEVGTAGLAEETAPLDVRLPLKEADRLPAPAFEQVPDGKPVGANRR